MGCNLSRQKTSNDLIPPMALEGLTCCSHCHAHKSPYPISGPITANNIITSGDPTSVHTALEIPEILRIVYKELARENEKRTLLSMAQVCRALTESALDAIWHNLVGLTPLLSVLPIGRTDKLMFIVTEESNRYAWQRFYSYAERVYEFTEMQDALSSQILRFLLDMKKDYCIFPNLQTLNSFYIFESTPPVLIERLITPSLRSLQVMRGNLELSNQKAADVFNKIFDILTTPRPGGAEINHSAQLQKFELPTTLPHSCLDQLVSLRQLRVLLLTRITPQYIGGVDYLQRLSTLPYLHTLILTVDDNESFRRVSQDSFASLKKLILQGTPLSLQSLLCALPSNRLEVIGIADIIDDWAKTVSGAEEVRTRMQAWCACFGALAQQASTLTELYIMPDSITANPDHAKACALDLPMMAIIKPLLELRKLQVITLAKCMKMPYSDADVRDVAAAWPKLKHMRLPPPCAEVAQPSLMSLRLLSRFCPRLENLAIGLDMNAGADVECNSELLQQLNSLQVPEAVTTHALTVLDVQESDMRKEDVARLADQLREWFPLLRKVVASQSKVAADLSEALLVGSCLRGQAPIVTLGDRLLVIQHDPPVLVSL